MTTELPSLNFCTASHPRDELERGIRALYGQIVVGDQFHRANYLPILLSLTREWLRMRQATVPGYTNGAMVAGAIREAVHNIVAAGVLQQRDQELVGPRRIQPRHAMTPEDAGRRLLEQIGPFFAADIPDETRLNLAVSARDWTTIAEAELVARDMPNAMHRAMTSSDQQTLIETTSRVLSLVTRILAPNNLIGLREGSFTGVEQAGGKSNE